MKAQELRIGNYVNRLGELTQIKAIQIGDKIGYISTPKSGAITINQIEPIELTEIWLENFGFKNRGLSGNLFIHQKNIGAFNRFIIETDGIDFYPQIDFNSCCFYELKYVHELQNLYFALTVEELTIK